MFLHSDLLIFMHTMYYGDNDINDIIFEKITSNNYSVILFIFIIFDDIFYITIKHKA